MILFTGHGEIYKACSRLFPCIAISARNITDLQLSESVSQATVVMHNSAIINGNTMNDYLSSNFQLTKRVFDIVRDVNKNCHFVYFGSMSYLNNRNEYEDFNILSDYAKSKLLGEQYCLSMQHVNTSCVRFSTIFYQNHKRDGVSKLIYQAVIKKQVELINAGIAKRDILPLDILAEYLSKLVCKPRGIGIYNIVSGKETSFIEITNFLMHKFNFKVTNKQQTLPSIVSRFSTKDIDMLGRIHFNLEDYLINYANSLQERIENENIDIL